MISILSPDSVVTRTSKNLRGIATHSCHHGKPEVTLLTKETDQRSATCAGRTAIRRISASPVPAWRMATSQLAHQR